MAENRPIKLKETNPDELKKAIERLTGDRARAKPLYELVQQEEFKVERVEVETCSHSHTPMSEMRFGERSLIYHTGQSTKTTISVKSEREIPVKTLVFHGPLAIRMGDLIMASIPRYEQHGEERTFGGDPSRIFYTDRAYKIDEEAIVVRVIGEMSKEVMRTDRSANYHNFKRPEKD